jgi:hypothetical protein
MAKLSAAIENGESVGGWLKTAIQWRRNISSGENEMGQGVKNSATWRGGKIGAKAASRVLAVRAWRGIWLAASRRSVRQRLSAWHHRVTALATRRRK